jgi:hypothetical protein
MSRLPRNQEGEHLISDVFVAQALFGDRISAIKHLLKEIIAFCVGTSFFALRDNSIGNGIHKSDMRVKSGVVVTVQGLEGFETSRTLLRLLQTINLESILANHTGIPSRQQRGACPRDRNY